MLVRFLVESKTHGPVASDAASVGTARALPQVFDRMPAYGLTPSIITFNSLIDACARAGDIDRARSVFCRLGEAGLRPNDRTFSALIHSHAVLGQVSGRTVRGAAAFGSVQRSEGWGTRPPLWPRQADAERRLPDRPLPSDGSLPTRLREETKPGPAPLKANHRTTDPSSILGNTLAWPPSRPSGIDRTSHRVTGGYLMVRRAGSMASCFPPPRSLPSPSCPL